LQPSTLAKRLYIFLLLAIIAFYLFGLGSFPLVGPDEPRYAQVAREMFLRNDFVTPTLGGHTWFEKPALLYWMMMLSFRVFGVTEFSVRFGPALCGILTVISVGVLSRQLNKRQQSKELSGLSFWTTLMTASSLGLIVFSRGGTFDVVITMTVSWALTFFVLYEIHESQSKRPLLLSGFYIFIGLSLMAKGLVGIVIPIGVVFVYYLLRRRWPERQVLTSAIWGIPLALAVASVWYGPVIARHGRLFIHEFFIEHHFARYLSNKYHHPQPFYFYPVIIILLVLPWTPVLIGALLRIREWNWRDESPLTIIRMFALAWVVFPLLFFSFSGSKLPGYILPVIPAAGLLMGERLTRIINGEESRWPLFTTGALYFLLSIGGLVYCLKTKQVGSQCALLATAPLLLASLYAMVQTRARDIASVSIACATCLTLIVVLKCAAPVFANRDSVRDLLRLGDERGYAGLPVLAQRGDDRSTEFYASGRVVYRPDGEILPIDEVSIDQARKLGKMLVFVRNEHLDYFRRVPGMEFIGDNGRMGLLGWTPR
jgi:4-amino-4-deoxy-L-arabinose transferase-like glycosyltransferase